MSGKKSSEVAAVLGRAEKTRKATDANYQNAAKKLLEELRKAGTAERPSLNIVGLSSTALKELPEEAATLQRAWDTLKTDFQGGEDLRALSDRLAERLASCDDKQRSLDTRAADVRKAIASKNWYCDDEYRQAVRIQSETEQLGKDKADLLRSLETASHTAADECVRYQRLASQNAHLVRLTEELNRRAADIVQLRKEAGKARECVRGMYAQADPALAKKFLPAEYQTLTASCNAFCDAEDAAAVGQLETVMAQMTAFLDQLQSKHEAWKAAKASAEDYLAKAEALVQQGKYYDPISYCADSDSAPAMSLFAFLAGYSDTDYEQRYEKVMQLARAGYAAEDFDGCVKHLKEAEILIGEAVQYAGLLQNQLNATVQLAVDTKGIMKRIGFKVGTSFRNGKDACDGFRITCKMGDEEINFTDLGVNADGTPRMEIDHKEGATNCGSSWGKLRQEFAACGIPITDVTKNGRSVIYGTSGAQESGRQTKPTH